MKVLVETGRCQGERKDDFHFTQSGELVYFGFVCDKDRRGVGDCGCARALSGAVTHRGTTTVQVVEKDLTAEAYEGAIGAAMLTAGWSVDHTHVRQMAAALLAVADRYPTGTVLECRRGVFRARTMH